MARGAKVVSQNVLVPRRKMKDSLLELFSSCRAIPYVPEGTQQLFSLTTLKDGETEVLF